MGNGYAEIFDEDIDNEGSRRRDRTNRFQLVYRCLLAVAGLLVGLAGGLFCMIYPQLRELQVAPWVVVTAVLSVVCLVLHIQYSRNALFQRLECLQLIAWVAGILTLACLIAFIVFGALGLSKHVGITDGLFISCFFALYTAAWSLFVTYYAKMYRNCSVHKFLYEDL